MNIKELREKLSKVDLLSAYPFINSYGISTKTNKETGNDELVVEFTVSKKIKLEYINDNYILPKSLSAYGIDIKTKVSESTQPSIQFTSDADEQIKYYEEVGINLEQSLDFIQLLHDYENYQTFIDVESNSLSAEINYSFHPLSQDIDPIKTNRQKARPLSGGCSSIFYPDGSDATLGLIVRDKQDKKIVALSNSHVYSRSLLIGEEASRFGKLSNTLNLSGRQPGNILYNKYGNTDPAVDHIGSPKRTSRLSTQNDNKVDACILELSSYNLLDANSNNIIWFKQKGPYQFATTDEIDSLVDPSSINYESPIFRSGRTLGPLGYPGNIIESTTQLPESTTSIVSLNESLTTNDGFNVLTHGISSIYFNFSSFAQAPSEGALIFTSADETSAFIIGQKAYYNRKNTRDALFYTNNIDYSPELAINDQNGIKEIFIFDNFFGSSYISKSNKIYYSIYFPSWVASLRFNSRYDEHRINYAPESNRNGWSLLLDSNDQIFSKPVKKSIINSEASFVLTEDNELWTMGANLCLTADSNGNPYTSSFSNKTYACGLPYEVNDVLEMKQSLTKLNKIPGDWIDFGYSTTLFDTTLYAISSNGELFTSYFTQYDNSAKSTLGSHILYNGLIQTPPQIVISTENWTISGSPDLSHTKVPLILNGNNIKVKKIFTRSDTNGFLGGDTNVPLLFQTEDDKILVITKPFGSTPSEIGYLRYNNEDIIVDQQTNLLPCTRMMHSNLAILSGNDYYGIGDYSSNRRAEDWIETIGNGTDYDIQNLLPYTTYFELQKWDNFPPNDYINLGGSSGFTTHASGSPNSSNFYGKYGLTLIYTDGVGLSGLGYSPSAIFNNYGEPLKDEVIMISVNTNVYFGRFTNSERLRFIENLDFKSKNKNGATAAGGDSGTALFACLSSTIPTLSTFKLVGLLYAGPKPSYQSRGLGVRIDNIQNELDIEPWDGVI